MPCQFLKHHDNDIGLCVHPLPQRACESLTQSRLRNKQYNHLTRLSTRITEEVLSVEEHLHRLFHILQPHNTPKEIRAVLEECAKAPHESILGLITRGYLLEGIYRKEGFVHEKAQHTFIESLPSDARVCWQQYDIGTRFAQRCTQKSNGSPIDIFPFDMA